MSQQDWTDLILTALVIIGAVTVLAWTCGRILALYIWATNRRRLTALMSAAQQQAWNRAIKSAMGRPGRGTSP